MTLQAAEIVVPPQSASSHARPERRLPLLPVASLLRAQHTLTAVERFSKHHDEQDAAPAQAKYYRDLIPLERPGPGEQYSFEVDLDACTGCKACVAACHSMNGLDEGEIWRSVGLLHGGTPQAPALQTITTSCHHCLDPACMNGCPVKAYEKDPVTGIVRHLDDQCFGCQYCTLMCPYDAPKFNRERGIVRKCDMCSDRLSNGEAPACVQGCPNQAIAIRVVDQSRVVEAGDAHVFLPGAPAPEDTLPTTVYRSKKPLPSNMLPADFYTTSPEHSHPPLVIMLTLTQLAAGAFALATLVERLSDRPPGHALAQAGFASLALLAGLAASVWHLGRPLLAWRAFLGVRTSWLSREAVAFGIFAKLALLHTSLVALPLFTTWQPPAFLGEVGARIQDAAALTGLLGVFCSVMVYAATKRPQWSGTQGGMRFFGTTLVLGAASVVAIFTVTRPPGEALGRPIEALLGLFVVSAALKLLYEGSALLHVRDRRHTAERRVASVMLGELRGALVLRWGALAIGGALLAAAAGGAAAGGRLTALVVVALTLLTLAELVERYLFFRAAPASRMPGGLR